MKKLISLILILITVFSIFIGEVYADELDEVEQKIISSSWKGGASSYSQQHNQSYNSIGNPKQCGVDALCLNGNGLYVNLIKYDYSTGIYNYVGDPLLIYSGGFLSEAHFVSKDASEAKLYLSVSSDHSSCVSTIVAEYKSEVITSYPSNMISYYPRGTSEAFYIGEGNKNRLRVREDNDLPKSRNDEVGTYINNFMAARTPTQILELFGVTLDMSSPTELEKELEKYYVSFEPALRHILSGEANVESEDCSGGVCNQLVTEKQIKPIGSPGYLNKCSFDERECKSGNKYSGESTCQSGGYGIGGGFLTFFGFSGASDRCHQISESIEEEKKVDKCQRSTSYGTCDSTTVGKSYVTCTGHEGNYDYGYYPYSWSEDLTENVDTCSKSTGDRPACNSENVDDQYITDCEEVEEEDEEGNKVKKQKKTYDKCSKGNWVTTKWDKKTYTCSDTDGEWNFDSCISWTPKYMHSIGAVERLYTNVYSFGSQVLRARDTTNKSLYKLVFETEEPGTANLVYNKDGTIKYGINGEPVYEYYVGPNKKEALVGENGNPFLLWPRGDTIQTTAERMDSYSISDLKKYTTGISIWWVPSDRKRCRDVDVCGYTNDYQERLKCAEDFCDAAIGNQEDWSVTKQKYACIRACLPNPDIDPGDNCNNPKSTSEYKTLLDKLNKATYSNEYSENVISDPTYSGGSSAISVKSKCLKDCTPFSSVERAGTNPSSEPGAIEKKIIEKTINNGINLYVVDNTSAWCSGDSDNTPVDQKTFTNIACVETNNYDFTNISGKQIIAGQGIEYKINQKGLKECWIWFDLPTWELWWASFHSREQLCIKYKQTADLSLDGIGDAECEEVSTSRKMLEKILDDYNKAEENGYTGILSNSISSLIDPNEQNALIHWTKVDYSDTLADGTPRTTAGLIANEKVSDEIISSKYYELINTNSDVLTLKSSSYGGTYGHLYNDLALIKTKSGKIYKTESIASLDFGTKKYCVSTDGNSEVYEADENGECDPSVIIKDGKKVNNVEKGKPYIFTTLGADAYSEDYKVEVSIAEITTVMDPEAIIPTGSNMKNYITQCEHCENGAQLSCNLTIVGNKIEGSVYSGSSVTANISYEGDFYIESYDDNKKIKNVYPLNIESYTIVVNPSSENDLFNATGKNSTTTITNAKLKNDVYCKVVGKAVIDGEEKTYVAYDYQPVQFMPGNGCRCSINVVSSSYNANTKIVTISDVWRSRGARKVSLGTSLVPEVTKELSADSRLHFSTTVTIPDDTSVTFYGYIDDELCCYKKVKITDEGDPPDCTKENKDKTWSLAQIEQFCSDHPNEVHGSKCVEECRIQCPPIVTCSLTEENSIDTWCTNYYKGAANETYLTDNCIQTCYSDNCRQKSYIFRPINNYNPFPNSHDSEPPYETGSRTVGSNWTSFTHYIKNDIDDSSSITGTSHNVEYVIDLTPDDLRKIKEDTANKKNNGDNPYIEYFYSEDLDDDYAGEYISSFIHDDNIAEGGFSSLFLDPLTYEKR